MFESVFLYAAVGGGVVLLTQLAMMFLGMDDGGFGEGADVGGVDVDVDVDVESDGATTDTAGFWFLEMLSLRTLAAAATFFGLVGGASNSMGWPPAISFALAILAGYSAMYGVYWTFKQLFKLETSGNEDVREAVGLPAEVYVPISAAGGPAGKIHVNQQGRTVEYQAVTDAPERLPTGAQVVITDVVGGDTVRVDPVGFS